MTKVPRGRIQPDREKPAKENARAMDPISGESLGLPDSEVCSCATKTCPACHTEKPASEFNRSVRTASGLDWQCKACKTAKLNRVAQRRRDERRKAFHSKQLRAREQARGKWGKAVDYPCSVLGCNAAAEHLHHVNYDEPLSVVPLCATHHKHEHTTLKVF